MLPILRIVLFAKDGQRDCSRQDLFFPPLVVLERLWTILAVGKELC
jgi:hypothetical protein